MKIKYFSCVFIRETWSVRPARWCFSFLQKTWRTSSAELPGQNSFFFTKASGLYLKSFPLKQHLFEKKKIYFDYFPWTLFQSWRVGEVLFRKRNPPHTWDGWTDQSTKGERLMINQWLITDSGLISLHDLSISCLHCIVNMNK